MTEDEFRAYVRGKMKADITDNLNPLIKQETELLMNAYEKGFWCGFELGLHTELKK